MTPDDECYFFGEYESGGGYRAGDVNNLISNFKKPVDRRGRPEYKHKIRVIGEVAAHIRGALSPDAFGLCTFVPIPPSKAKDHPLYDDRLVQALREVDPNIDVRELIVTTKSSRAHHEYGAGESRPTPDDLYGLLAIDKSHLTTPLKPTVFLFDDVLTNGTHFKACQRLLRESCPEVSIIGLFIGRVKRPEVFAGLGMLLGGHG